MYEKTKEKITEYLDSGVFPGVSFAFIRGKEIESATMGLAQVFPEKEPLTQALLFDVASLTKVICTTTVVLQLIEAGTLVLDQPLAVYYTAFQDKKITLRHLLTHTSDICTYIENRDSLSKEELIQAYAGVQSGEQLGLETKYTDAGTILLGLMLEELLQKDAVEIFNERVLKPLEMTDSCFLPTDPLKTVPSENHPVRGAIRGQTHDPKAFTLAEHAGNAGLFTNLKDLQKFVQMYLDKGSYNGKSLLKAETILALPRDYSFAKNHQRSLGWDLKEEASGNQLLFHTGYTGTFLLIDVLAEEAFIFLSNRVHPTDKRVAYIKDRDALIQVYLEEKSKLGHNKEA